MTHTQEFTRWAALWVGAQLFTGCWITGQGGYGYRAQASVNVPRPAVTVQTQPRAPGTNTNASLSVATPLATARFTATVTLPATGVTVLQSACQQGAPEACNGLDDNCNGVIDEGCGYQGGNIQVTAAWQTSSDIDLHVVDPTGEEVYFGHRQSSSGGVLDHDANAACQAQPPTVENIFWSSPSPPPGQYNVRIVAYDMCTSPNTPVTMSISVGGRVLGVYSLSFTYSRQEFSIPFTLQ